MNFTCKMALLGTLLITAWGSGGCASSQLGAAKGAPGADWLSWRGPTQDGAYRGPKLPTDLSLGGPSHRWTAALPGGGTPVISGQALYVMATRGEGEAMVEILASVSAATGEILWERRFPDFLSDIIYERYAIGSPAIHEASDTVLAFTSAGVLWAHDRAGVPRWSASLMESYGRLTFPNGRTGSPTVVGDLVVVRGITAAWGKHAPGRDRLFAFEITTGRLAWTSTPGERPIDSSYSTPVVLDWGGHVALLTGTGCGNVVAIDARNGELLWRKKISRGGVNATPIVGDGWVAIPHGKGRLTSSKEGGFVTFAIPSPDEVLERGKVLPSALESDQLPATSFSSSPVRLGPGVAQVTATGDVLGIDPVGRSINWSHKVGNENLHASPLSTSSHIYVPLSDGTIHVLSGDFSAGRVSSTKYALDGASLSAPSASRGRLFLQTRGGLHAFGDAQEGETSPPQAWPVSASAPLPAELHLRPGDQASLHLHGGVRSLSCAGKQGGSLRVSYANGNLSVDPTSPPGACQLEDSTMAQDSRGGVQLRLRVSPGDRYEEGFQSFSKGDRPPIWWLGAGKKWIVGEQDGNRVLEKTLGILLFQRATTLFGHPEEHGYTLSAKVRSDGNRRGMGSVGLVNQRYLIVLDGNRRELVVSSNYDRLHRAQPFRWKAGTWYHLKTRVDVDPGGVAVIRAKAWASDEDEPVNWTMKVEHNEGHRAGACGVYGFSPQAQHKVFIDDIRKAPSLAIPTKGGS